MTTPPNPDDAGALLQAIQEQIAAVLQGMREDLTALAGRLTTLEQRLAVPDAERVPGTPVVWGRLEAAEYDELWPQFIDWVTWLADTYELTPDQLPRCWHHHGGVVAELTDLWTGHQEPVYHLIADPAPVVVKVREGTPLTVAAQVPGTVPPAARPPAATPNTAHPRTVPPAPPAPRPEVAQPQ
ncbi:hypothetical protein GCM10010182_67050 [Actinomadura cremea]|nr:hypothetical protein GCM10010182_67050 [Actinomadura cremea]